MVENVPQWLNGSAFVWYPYVRLLDRSLAIPHLEVKSIADLQPRKIKQSGIDGVIFDKDNTLSRPYVDEVVDDIRSSYEEFISVFGAENLLIVSNCAGSRDDPKMKAKEEVEKVFGIKVLTHWMKKPGKMRRLNSDWSIPFQKCVMIGDRVVSDIIFGNRYGMATILVDGFTHAGEIPALDRVRSHEHALIRKWMKKGLKPPQIQGLQVDEFALWVKNP